MDEIVGKLLASRYRISGPLGEGGMGVVYRAVDEQLRRTVAIKLLSNLPGDRDWLSRLRNEALALSALNHPHIVTVFEIGDAADTPFIATEFVDGETLRQRLRRGPLPLREALDLALQTARALGAAHEHQIVHRDIKPENLMLRRDGYVKVLDFGLAVQRPALLPQPAAPSLSLETVEAIVAGTPGYMSPEQVNGENIDARSDIFSLGIVLCEAVTGKNPFARATRLEALTAIGRASETIAEISRELPPAIAGIVRKALQHDPAARYRTMADFAADLSAAIAAIDSPPSSSAAGNRRVIGYVAVAVIVAIVGAAIGGTFRWRRIDRQRWVRDEATPQIKKLIADEKPAAAFAILRTAETYLPGDAELATAASAGTRIASIDSTPQGASIEIKDYLSPDEAWMPIGTTPLDHVRVPAGFLRWRVSKPGVGEYVVARLSEERTRFELDRAVAAPPGMVPVAGGLWTDAPAFFGWLGPYRLPPYFIDRYEVTNREFQAFVDKGGYQNRAYWKQPFVKDGRTIAWDEAMTAFRDSTGRPGPAAWEAGHYPAGKDDFPVTGVSWFEAAAYAEFAEKSLPVIAEGYMAEPTDLDQYVMRLSNLTDTLTRVGTSQGLGAFGTFDLIGNVREWYWNASSDDRRYALGRNAASYGPEALPPWDRSALNGFRCVRNQGPLPAETLAMRPLIVRDFSKAKPVSDEVFRVYRNMYAYDKTPLHATVEPAPDGADDWTREKITFDPAYRDSRMSAFLYLPKHAVAPLQTIVFFPSARVNFATASATLGDLEYVDYVIKSGRAVIYPIYQSLYERRHGTPTLPGPALERETIIDWSKDLGRSIDYLETRKDIDTTRIGYLGVSQGSAYGVILAALENRLKAVVFLDGGYLQNGAIEGTDPVDFAPRLTKPVLMINGRYDSTFPVEAAQLPMLRMLGAPAVDKRHVVFETPHDVNLRRADLVREVLGWYDKYLGRVN